MSVDKIMSLEIIGAGNSFCDGRRSAHIAKQERLSATIWFAESFATADKESSPIDARK